MATHGGHYSLYTLDGGSIDGRFAPATPRRSSGARAAATLWVSYNLPTKLFPGGLHAAVLISHLPPLVSRVVACAEQCYVGLSLDIGPIHLPEKDFKTTAPKMSTGCGFLIFWSQRHEMQFIQDEYSWV
ncbi:hypothetical protein K438DRAFT_1777456 [Mycena galopus ATCC 62051]|nr:hypothetical protein K438DRAFT_1777456 [Mycena galopus ATCC 62051]